MSAARSMNVIIVGGGAMGLSTAWLLAQRNYAVTVLDGPKAARQASWAAAGILPPANLEKAHNDLERLRGLSHRLFPELAEQLKLLTDIDIGYHQSGGIYIARGAGEAASLHAAARQWSADGVTVDAWTPDDLIDRAPQLESLARQASLQAIYSLPDECQVRSPWYVQALRAACQLAGVAFHDNLLISDFRTTGNTVTQVVTDRGSFSADVFCLTAGAWTRPLLERLGVHIEMQPWRGQMLLFDTREPLFHLIVNEGPKYIVPRPDGKVLIGSTMEETEYNVETTADGINELKQFVAETVPQLARQPVQDQWAGLRPGTGDGFPYIGRTPNMSNVFVATGHFRSGVQLSPSTALVVADLIEGKKPIVDVSLFRIDRG